MIPFFLAKIKKKEQGKVWVQFWEVDPDPKLKVLTQSGTINYFDSCWGATKANADGTKIHALPCFDADDDRFIIEVKMIKKTTKVYPAKIKDAGKSKLRYLVEMWDGGADHEVEFEDIFE